MRSRIKNAVSGGEKKHKPLCKKHKAHILKYMPCISKYMPCIFSCYKLLINSVVF